MFSLACRAHLGYNLFSEGILAEKMKRILFPFAGLFLFLGCQSTPPKPTRTDVTPIAPSAPDLKQNRQRMIGLAMSAMDIDVYWQGGETAIHQGRASLELKSLLKLWTKSERLHPKVRSFISREGVRVFDEKLPKAPALPATIVTPKPDDDATPAKSKAKSKADANAKSDAAAKTVAPKPQGPAAAPEWLAAVGGFHQLGDGRKQIIGRAKVSKIRNEGLARQTLANRLRRDFTPRLETFVDALLKAYATAP